MKATILCILLLIGPYLPKSHADILGATVLSDNQVPGKKSNFLPGNTAFIKTGATYKWIKEGKYATDEETLKTGANPKILFDGNNGENWKSRTYSKWNGGSWATILIDLKREYLIDKIDIWRLHEKTRDTEQADILLSLDGKKFTLQGLVKDNEKIPYQAKKCIKISKEFPKPVLSRYIKLRIKRRKGARQQQIGEIVIWGRKLNKKINYLKAGAKPPVEFTIKGIQSGAAAIDWSAFPVEKNDIKKWKIYYSNKPFKKTSDANVNLAKTIDGKKSKSLIYPLKPNTLYYFGVSAVYKNGENEIVKCTEYKTPGAIECKKFGDMLAINHFWGGGGARALRENNAAWETIALELLSQTPVKQIRWWESDPKIVEKYYAKGIGLLTYPQGNNLNNASKLGIHLIFSGSNEPDLSGQPIEKYIATLKHNNQKMKQMHPDAFMTAPSSGMDEHSIEWLKSFYEKGGKDFFDVLDLHTYTKIAGGHKVPEGYPKGAPEALFDNMRKIREVTDAFNDSGKPVISTEFGYTNCATDNPSGTITPLIQAQYLIRGLIIHYALGFKRVFIYSFWDDGVDPDYTEHHFGMVDYDLQKKPSFFAFCTLGKELGNCTLLSKSENLSPGFGYNFKDQKNDDYVTVVWNGAGASLGSFKTTAPFVTMTDMLGKSQKLMVASDKTFTLAYGSSPVYLKSSQPITALKCVKTVLETKKQEGVKLKLLKKQLIALDGEKVELRYTITNDFATKTETNLRVCTNDGKTISEKKQTLNPGEKKSDLITFAPPEYHSALENYLLAFSYTGKYSTLSKNLTFFVRFIKNTPHKTVTQKEKMSGTENDFYILSNPFLEVSFAPDNGGRMIDLVNKQLNSNQLNIDYSKLPNLVNIPFAYGIWDKLNGQLKNAKYQVSNAKDGRITLTAETTKKLKIIKNWILEKNKLTLKLKIINESDKEKKVSYYLHPEYHVGGTGDSVMDVFFLPNDKEVIELPFWSGLGSKGNIALTKGWCGILDKNSGEYLKIDYAHDKWNPPRIWFGNGSYNLEMQTAPDSKIKPGQSWETELSWTIENNKKADFNGGF